MDGLEGVGRCADGLLLLIGVREDESDRAVCVSDVNEVEDRDRGLLVRLGADGRQRYLNWCLTKPLALSTTRPHEHVNNPVPATSSWVNLSFLCRLVV